MRNIYIFETLINMLNFAFDKSKNATSAVL